MNKQRIRIAVKVLDELTVQFLASKELIEQEQECLKENISVEEVLFLFTCLEAKS